MIAFDNRDMIDHQSQFIDTVAAISAAETVEIDARLGEILVTPEICIVGADCVILDVVECMDCLYDNFEDTVTAAFDCLQRITIDARSGAYSATEIVGGAVAHLDCIANKIFRKDGDSDFQDAVTAMNCPYGVIIDTLLREIPATIGKRRSLADFDITVHYRDMVDDQTQFIDTVTAVTAPETIEIGSALGQIDITPEICVIGADCIVLDEVVGRSSLEQEFKDAVTTSAHGRNCIVIDARSAEQTATEKVGIAAAYLDRITVHILRRYADHYPEDTVTAGRGGEGVVIDAWLRVIPATEIEG